MNLYLDSMQWIDFLEERSPYDAETNDMMLRIRSASGIFLSNHLILAEVLVMPKRLADLFTATKYRHYFLCPSVRLIPLTTDAAERLADICASTRVKPADALHLALAASATTDYFVTTDTKLHSLTISEICQICPPETVP